MLSIGEFSKVTGLTVKALRFYHEHGVLAPAFVGPQSGYRYYRPEQVETARLIAFLRKLEFPVGEIADLLRKQDRDEELLSAVERHRAALDRRIKELHQSVRALDQYISEERQAQVMSQSAFEVQEKVLEPMLVGGVRMRGRYDECGKGFAKVGRAMGRHIGGKPMLLHYDCEYKEHDADFEACFPVGRAAQGKAIDGVAVRELPGGRCVSLLHKGPYDQLGRSYARVFQYVRDKGYAAAAVPTREVYHKGPGMIFKGNPKNYLTEIQVLVDGAAGG